MATKNKAKGGPPRCTALFLGISWIEGTGPFFQGVRAMRAALLGAIYIEHYRFSRKESPDMHLARQRWKWRVCDADLVDNQDLARDRAAGPRKWADKIRALSHSGYEGRTQHTIGL